MIAEQTARFARPAGVLRRRVARRRCRRSHAGDHLAPAVDRRRHDRAGVGDGVQDRARTEPREDRLRAHLLRDAADPRSRSARRRHGGQRDRHRHRGLRAAARRRSRRPRTPARSPSSTVSRRRASATRSARPPAPSSTLPSPRRRWRPPSCPVTGPTSGPCSTPCRDLAEQDPLINLRQDDARQELFLSLYGEVQKEIVAQTLAARLRTGGRVPPDDTGVHRAAEPPRDRRWSCARRGARRITRSSPPSGLAIAPLPPGSGVTFELAVGVTSIPIHVFDSVDAFRR